MSELFFRDTVLETRLYGVYMFQKHNVFFVVVSDVFLCSLWPVGNKLIQSVL